MAGGSKGTPTWRRSRTTRRRNLAAAQRAASLTARSPAVQKYLPVGFRDAAELHTLMRLAATPEHAIVPIESTRPIGKPSEPLPADRSEGAMHAWSMRVRASADGPPIIPRFKVGTFARDSDGDVFELRRLALNDPRLHLPEGEPYGAKWNNNTGITKYRRWMRAGSMPPPAWALETDKGNTSIRDGHHRASALRRSGRTHIEAWVGLTHNYPISRSDGTTYTVPRGVTHEQAKQLVADVAKAVRAAR